MASNKIVDRRRTPEIVDGKTVWVHQRTSATHSFGRTVTREIVAPGQRSQDLEGALFDVRTKSGLSKIGYERIKKEE